MTDSPLAPSTAAALDRAAAKLGGHPTREDDDVGPRRPLVFDGVGWTRSPLPHGPACDAFGDPLPQMPIGPGWWLESLTQTWAGDPAPIPRAGVCVRDYVNGDGERVFECVEQHSEALVTHVHRLDVTYDDIALAVDGRRFIAGLRKTVMDALSHSRRARIGHTTTRAWVDSAYSALGAIGGRPLNREEAGR